MSNMLLAATGRSISEQNIETSSNSCYTSLSSFRPENLVTWKYFGWNGFPNSGHNNDYQMVTLRKSSTPDVTSNDIQIPRNTEIKYLGMTIDSKLTWKQHIAKERKQVNITIKQLNWLLGRK
jgi:hypothetical protein